MRNVWRTAMAGTVIALVALGGCGSKDASTEQSASPPTSSSRTSSPPTSSTTTKTRRPGVSPTATSTADGGPGSGGNTLPAGTHFGYYVNSTTDTVAGQSVSVIAFDKAEVLTGAKATEAAKAHGGDPEVPNGVFVVNDNKAVRTLPIKPGAKITVLDLNNPSQVLAGQLHDLHPDTSPIEIDVVIEKGVSWVTEVRERYLP